jgi:murein DD-endopeptidase MepM/ murein hydrolase activator NlpD
VAEEGLDPSGSTPAPPDGRPRLDPSRPLRMPGASLREPERPLLGALWAALTAVGRAVAARMPKAARAPARGGQWGLKLAIGGLVVFAVFAIGVVPIVYEPPAAPSAPETTQAVEPSAAALVDAGALDAAVASPAPPAPPPPPRTFRVRSLAEDPEIEIVEGSIAKRAVLAALTSAGLSTKDAFRAIHAFHGKTFDRPQASDAFVYARRRSDHHLVAFEYIVPPFDVWQAREGTDGRLEGKKVEFSPEHRRVARAVVVGEDLRKSLAQAELDDDLLGMLDDALDGHADLVDMRPGARLRVVAMEERIEGTFARYGELDAVEYTPANPKSKSVRVYRFDPDGRDHGTTSRKTAHLFYDEHGRQPYKGGFRSPLPLGHVTSRFNPRRMHPILHVMMPHNGVDFAAPIGTPIYATAAGLVRVAANVGPNGNMVQLLHANGLVSAYCHMSRFAASLHAGQHVESRQLLGYVGQTGRSTGPHLHFAIKRGNVFLDPLSLRLDGVRTLPPSDREAFDKVRAELDAALESVALPAAPEATNGGEGAAAEAEDVIYDEVPDAGADGASPP